MERRRRRGVASGLAERRRRRRAAPGGERRHGTGAGRLCVGMGVEPWRWWGMSMPTGVNRTGCRKSEAPIENEPDRVRVLGRVLNCLFHTQVLNRVTIYILYPFQIISHSKNLGESKFFKFDQIYMTR